MMGWGNMMWGYGPGYGNYGIGYWWMGLIGMAIQVIFWIAIIAIVWRLVSRYNFRLPTGHSQSNNAFNNNALNNNALNILRERFAKGEIDSEEYTRRKEELLH